jgi:hypothetical protein
MRCAVIYGIAYALLSAASAQAGQSPALAEGSRIRLQLRGLETSDVPGKVLVGRLEVMRDDGLMIALRGRATPLSIRRSAIARLDVSQGRQTRGAGFARGAGLGLLLGTAGGALFGLASNSSGGGLFNYSTSDVAALGAIYGGALGVLIGGSLGIAFPGERWTPVPTKRTHVYVMPVRRGVGVRLAVRF